MSTISEIDIRDWEGIDTNKAQKELNFIAEDVSKYGIMIDIKPLNDFINEVETLRRKTMKQIPALFKKEIDG